MTTRIRLCLPFPPSVNRWKDPGSGHAYLTPEVKRYKAAADALVRRWLGKVEPITGPVWLSIDLYRPTRTGDISNRIKILEDCLRGLVFNDDSQVEWLQVRRFEDKVYPRAEVTVHPPLSLAVARLPMSDAMVRDAVEVGRILAESRRKATQARAKKAAPARDWKTLAQPASYRGKP